jgi:hypothetical protein
MNQVKGISDLRTYQQMQEKERKKRPILQFEVPAPHLSDTRNCTSKAPNTKLQLSYVVITNAHNVVLQP